MKISRKGSQSGFSLIELMVVILIIITLAGMIAAALPGIQTSITRKNTRSFMAEIESGLERYQIDNGIYPLNPEGGGGIGDRDQTGRLGAEILYKHLSGDYDEDGKVDFGEGGEADEVIYVQRLDYNSNKDSERPRSVKGNDGYVIIDPFNSPIRYLAQPPNIKSEERDTFNPTYDLWSISGTNPADADVFSVQAKYITNWQSSN